MLLVALARSVSRENAVRYVLPVSRMTLYTICRKVEFPTHSQAATTMFDFVVVYNGSKWRTEALRPCY